MSDSSVYLAAEQVRVAIINTNHMGTKKNFIILKRSVNCCCIRSTHLAGKLQRSAFYRHTGNIPRSTVHRRCGVRTATTDTLR